MTAQQIDQQIYDMAIANGFNKTSALFVVAQARLESADYTSNVFKKNNNAFGMKFIKQPLATKGTPAPASEGDFYAKFTTPADSAKDVITRNYQKTRAGITPDMIKQAQTPTEYSTLLKKRGYYGASASQYANGITSKLKKIKIADTLPGVTIVTPKKKFNALIIGAVALFGIFWYVRKKR